MVLPLINAFFVAHKTPLLVKVDCSGIVSRVVGLLHRRGFKSAYSLMKRMKELEDENRRLKKMYAEERLKSEIIQEAMAKKW